MSSPALLMLFDSTLVYFVFYPPFVRMLNSKLFFNGIDRRCECLGEVARALGMYLKPRLSRDCECLPFASSPL